MQSKHIFSWIIVPIFALFFSPTIAHAVNPDFSILCQDKGTCKQLGTQNLPIFTEQNIVPGQSFSRTLKVKNDNKLHSCQLHLRLSETEGTAENELAEKLLVQVFHDKALLLGTPVAGPASLTINQLQTETFARYFWSLPPKVSEQFDLTITFDPQAGNKYQGTNAVKDIAIAITCLQEDEFSPISETGVVLPNPNQEIIEVPLEGCEVEISQTQPKLAITNVDAKRGAVSFSWTPVTDVAEYWLEFGTEQNSQQFRHRGITATSYTVLNLDLQYDLSFRVLPVRDCAKGEYSNTAHFSGKEGQKIVENEEENNAQVLGSQERVVDDREQSGEFLTDNVSRILLVPLLLFTAVLILYWRFFRLRNALRKKNSSRE